MKISAVIIGFLGSQGFGAVDANGFELPDGNIIVIGNIGPCVNADPDNKYCQLVGRRKLLAENTQDVNGHVLMGTYGADNEIFVATNATFPTGITNGTLTVAISDSKECSSDAHDRASEFQLENSVTYEINELGMIEGEGGWFQQSIRELQGNSSTLPVSLAELINGVAAADDVTGLASLFNGDASDYGLAVYLKSSDASELLGCASLQKLDENMATEYNDLLNGNSQEAVKEDSSSGSKIGLFLSAVAAFGIAVVLGDVLAM